MPSEGDSFEVMLRLKLPRGNFNLAVMNNLYWSSGRGTNVHLSNVHSVLRDISSLLGPSWGS